MMLPARPADSGPSPDPEASTFATTDLIGELSETEAKFAPSELHLMGDWGLLRRGRRVSVIGSRKASPDALSWARRLSQALVKRQVTVVSGLAAGIDTVAHSTAIESGGRTIAVLGTPVHVAYPKSNAALHRSIVRQHLAVSQFPTDAPVRRWNFPKRNRTMALLSDATVIVAAGERSGTIHQGSEVLRLGRPLGIRECVASKDYGWISKFLACGATVLDQDNLSSWIDGVKGLSAIETVGDASLAALHRSVTCGTYFAYSPQQLGRLGPGAKQRCRQLKDRDQGLIGRLSAHMATQRQATGIAGILGPRATLVPMPRHVPNRPLEQWPSHLLACEMVSHRLGCQVVPMLERSTRVPKSACAQGKAGRPTALTHYKSFRVRPPSVLDATPEKIVIVDDVVTLGATMLAAISAVANEYDVPVCGFAAVRTAKPNQPIERVPDPELCELRLLPDGRTEPSF